MLNSIIFRVLPLTFRLKSYPILNCLLGRPMLQARLENLQSVGPDFDLDYFQNRAMLNTLNVGPTLDPRFQTYRYLRTPEEPVKRDSPRRAFLMIMWGIVGALIGAGVALTRRRTI